MQRSAIGTRPCPNSQAFQSSRTADCTAIGTGLGRPFLADDFERCACPTALVLQHRSEHRPAGVAFLQLGAEVVADLGENRREVLDRQSRKDLTPVFCDKDQMDVKAVNDVPSGADILHIAIRPINSLGMILTYRYRVKDKGRGR